jgi:hypothetical protein
VVANEGKHCKPDSGLEPAINEVTTLPSDGDKPVSPVLILEGKRLLME